MKAKRLLWVAGMFFLCTALWAGPLMRFPDIHENTVVFVCGEDIWSVPAAGGIATRLTLHDGQERFPKISPDGKWIAFTGEYDGNGDVYVMDIHGGGITRVTFHPGYDQVIGWHPTRNKILFNANRTGYGYSRLYLINPDGTGLESLIMHEAAQGSFSPDGGQIAYNKVSRENRTWKRYQGGLAQEVHVYDFARNTETNISNFRGTDRIPIWMGESIYFSSDRDGVLNLYQYNTQNQSTTQVTSHTEYDIRRPSGQTGKIVYELGGEIWMLDTASGLTNRIPIQVLADTPDTRPHWKDVTGLIQDIGISPSGKRVLIVARGEVFTVPKKEGEIRNLTQDSGSRDKDAAWSPDGSKIAYFSDRTGEYELYICDPMGTEQPMRLTEHKNGYRHTLRWSPDSKKIGFTDQALGLYFVDVATKKITSVDKAAYENIDVSLDVKPIYDFAWSPDSRYLAYTKMDADLVEKVYVYSLEEGKARCISNGLFNDFGPVFSRDGKYLFFISNRNFDPVFCDFEWQMVYKNAAGIYAVTLQKNGKPFLPLESDEEITDQEESAAAGTMMIDFEGIQERVEELPLPPSNYRNLSASETALFYLNKDVGDFNRFEFRGIGPRDLYAFDLDEKEERTVIRSIDDYQLSHDGTAIVYQSGNDVGIVSASAEEAPGDGLNLSDLRMWLEPKKEWQQIFLEAWRMERDFYYEPKMQGVDWNLMKTRYQSMMDRACCRQDVQFVVGELIGELNTSHTYVFGGDAARQAEPIGVGMLGADWEEESKSGRFRVKKILSIPDWTNEVMPPLSKPGLKIAEGHYLLKVNGQEVTTTREIYSYFQNLANKTVTLTVNDKPAAAGAWEIRVKTLGNEGRLRYMAWMEHNRLVCERESGGKIGYLHLPDTYTGSATEFPKYWYSQTRKQGLIIDGRFNGGGLDPIIFLSRLNSPILSYWTRRYSHDQTGPPYATRAHMVCLTNRQAGSGGDELPHEFQQLGLGPVIGTRTWGGLVGVSNFISLIDGGGLTAPDYRIYSPEGKWVVENEGVQPDIEVDLHPAEMAAGTDAQLMEGIRYLLKKIADEPRVWPQHPPYPVDPNVKK